MLRFLAAKNRRSMSTTQTQAQAQQPEVAWRNGYNTYPATGQGEAFPVEYIKQMKNYKKSKSQVSSLKKRKLIAVNLVRTSRILPLPDLLEYHPLNSDEDSIFNDPKLKHESVLYCIAKTKQYINSAATALEKKQRRFSVTRDFFKLLWHVDVYKDHGHDYNRAVVNDILSEPRWETNIFGVPGKLSTYNIIYVGQNMYENQWKHIEWGKEEVFDYLFSFKSVENKYRSLLKNLLLQNPPGGALIFNAEEELLVNTITGTEYEFMVKDIMGSDASDANVNAQALEIKTFLGDNEFLAIVDTSNNFDRLLNSPNFEGINMAYLVSTKIDPAKKLNYESNEGAIYKRRYYKEIAPTGTDEIKYITYPAYNINRHEDKLSHFFSRNDLIINLFSDTNNEIIKGTLRASITFLDNGQVIEVQAGENVAGCIDKIIKSIKQAMNINQTLLVKKKVLLSKEAGDNCQVLDEFREIRCHHYASGLSNANDINSMDYKKMKVSIDYNFHAKGLADDNDAAIIYNNGQGKMLILKNPSLNDEAAYITQMCAKLSALITNEELLIIQNIQAYELQRNQMINKARQFQTLIQQKLTVTVPSSSETIITKQNKYKNILIEGMKIMALLPYVPRVNDNKVNAVMNEEERTTSTIISEAEKTRRRNEAILPSYTITQYNTDVSTVNGQIIAAAENSQAKLDALREKQTFLANIQNNLKIPAKYRTLEVFKNVIAGSQPTDFADVYLEKQVLLELFQNTSIPIKKKFDDVWSVLNLRQSIDFIQISSIQSKLGSRFSTYWCLDLVRNTYNTIKAVYPDEALLYINALKRSISGNISETFVGISLDTKFKFGIRLLGILNGTPAINFIGTAPPIAEGSDWARVFGTSMTGGGIVQEGGKARVSQMQNLARQLGVSKSEFNFSSYAPSLPNKKQNSHNKTQKQTSHYVSYTPIRETQDFTVHIDTTKTLPDIKLNMKKIILDFIKNEKKLNSLTRTQEIEMIEELLYLKIMIDEINDMYKIAKMFANIAQLTSDKKDELNANIIKEIHSTLHSIHFGNQNKLNSKKSKIKSQKGGSNVTIGDSSSGFFDLTHILQDDHTTNQFVFFPVSIFHAYREVLNHYYDSVQQIMSLRESDRRNLRILDILEKIAAINAFIDSLSRDEFRHVIYTGSYSSSSNVAATNAAVSANLTHSSNITSSLVAPSGQVGEHFDERGNFIGTRTAGGFILPWRLSSDSSQFSTTHVTSELPSSRRQSSSSSTTTTTRGTGTRLVHGQFSGFHGASTLEGIPEQNNNDDIVATTTLVPSHQSATIGRGTLWFPLQQQGQTTIGTLVQHQPISASRTGAYVGSNSRMSQQQNPSSSIISSNPFYATTSIPIHLQQQQQQQLRSTTMLPSEITMGAVKNDENSFGGGRRQTLKRQSKRKNKTSKNKKLKA